MTTRINKHCAYYPCHEDLEDCTFCFCPFYPCRDERLGGYVYSKKLGKIWSCENCSWIHKRKVVDGILKVLRNGSSIFRREKRERRKEKRGVIILGHGSKIKKANEIIPKIIKKIKKNGLSIVEPAYLQLAEPSLSKSIKNIVKKGCRRIAIIPFFLFMGNHVSRDIPKAIRKEMKIHKTVEFVYAKNLGQDPRISDIVMDRIREAI